MTDIAAPPPDRGLYALALLCIACGHQAVGDETLAQMEVDKATELVHRWKPAATPAEIGRILAKAMEIYKSIGDDSSPERRGRACARLVRRDFDDQHLEQILEDLRDIVSADGIVSQPEAEFLDAVRHVFAGPA